MSCIGSPWFSLMKFRLKSSIFGHGSVRVQFSKIKNLRLSHTTCLFDTKFAKIFDIKILIILVWGPQVWTELGRSGQVWIQFVFEKFGTCRVHMLRFTEWRLNSASFDPDIPKPLAKTEDNNFHATRLCSKNPKQSQK